MGAREEERDPSCAAEAVRIPDATQWPRVGPGRACLPCGLRELGDRHVALTPPVRFYANPLVYSVNLNTLDFSGAAGKPFPVPASPTSIDLTSKLAS